MELCLGLPKVAFGLTTSLPAALFLRAYMAKYGLVRNCTVPFGPPELVLAEGVIRNEGHGGE